MSLDLPEFEKPKQASGDSPKQRHAGFLFGWRDWLTIVGVALGVGGPVIGYHVSKQERVPVFVVDPARTQILDTSRVSRAPIKVVKANGDPVDDDLTAVRFYFWNAGRVPITSSDVLEPLRLRLQEETAEILDFKILKTSRAVIDFQLSRDPEDSEKTLILSFRTLERWDGAICDLMFEGPRRSGIVLEGTIAGPSPIVPSPYDETGFVIEVLWRVAYVIVLLSAFYAALVAVVLLIGRLTGWESFQSKPSNSPATKPEWRRAMYLILLIVSIFVAIAVSGLQREPRTNPYRMVPPTLRID